MPDSALPIVNVAVPSPLRRTFDYLAGGLDPQPGMRVRVPFGRREVIGIVIGRAAASDLPREKLRRLGAVLDSEPVFSPSMLALIEWAASYYHHPLGEVCGSALPVRLRQGDPAESRPLVRVGLSAAGRAAIETLPARAARQRAVLQHLLAHAGPVDVEGLREVIDEPAPVLRALEQKGWVAFSEIAPESPPRAAIPDGPALSEAQRVALDDIRARLDGYHAMLLHGVTGSGKTEVYLRAMAEVVRAGRQVLVLVPEIGLAPQTLARFRERFGARVLALHSALTDVERLRGWQAAREGRVDVVIGTRSAVFTPFAQLGLLIVDEEHDASYKQQEGFRYSARDVAVMRAAREKIPVLLGSATPSLESVYNARSGRYTLIALPDRAGGARLPTVRLLDTRQLARHDGLSAPLVAAINERLAAREQSLLFINRRGFAPVMLCGDCGWMAPCPRCDARLTWHRRRAQLLCHHCGTEASAPTVCPACGSTKLKGVGEGTERVEESLQRLFPAARIARVDRDSTRRKGALESILDRVAANEVDILVGTQMLAKGHDFPNLTLVGVLNADQGLFSVDFRADETLTQQISQVAGRAGRADKAGEVLIQTTQPAHPLFAALVRHDFNLFADEALREREQAGYPPFMHLALLRAEAAQEKTALGFLAAARAAAAPHAAGVTLMDPVPAPMERRAGRFRAQLLVQSRERRALHAFLDRWLAWLDDDARGKKVRWSLDVDPGDLY